MVYNNYWNALLCVEFQGVTGMPPLPVVGNMQRNWNTPLLEELSQTASEYVGSIMRPRRISDIAGAGTSGIMHSEMSSRMSQSTRRVVNPEDLSSGRGTLLLSTW